MSSNKPDTRTKILESTWKLLETTTGDDVRMSDIAKEAGVSRQAVYLHFPNRVDLLIATTRYLDEVKDVDGRLAASRSATTGLARLDAFIEAWGNYIPEIFGVAAALLAMQDKDPAAKEAWSNRMQAVREGCEEAVKALDRDGRLRPELDADKATDLLWTLLMVHNWRQLTVACGWTQEAYVDAMKALARRMLVCET
ncbi:TetR/AcrR family transcriptional regulator [Hoeflea sp. CAU 1731]